MNTVGDVPQPLDVPDWEPELHIAPTALLQLLREGVSLCLVDLRLEPVAVRLRGAEPLSGGFGGDKPWSPPPGVEVVLVDHDGRAATEAARAWRRAGYERVRALYGGMRLYEGALDVQVVGERFLEPLPL